MLLSVIENKLKQCVISVLLMKKIYKMFSFFYAFNFNLREAETERVQRRRMCFVPILQPVCVKMQQLLKV